MTEPYEVVIVGEGQNLDALPKLLCGFFTAQSENRK